MMHGFGDDSEPLIESAKIIEEVVLHQMRGIICEACKIAEMRDSLIVSAEEFLFLLRKDKIKLQRLLNYLSKLNACILKYNRFYLHYKITL